MAVVIDNTIIYPFPKPSRDDPNCTRHIDLKFWLCSKQVASNQGQIKVNEGDVWQTLDHGFTAEQVGKACVYITGNQTSNKGYYRVVTEIISNNALRVDRPWPNEDQEGIPTDWVRLIRDQRGERNLVGVDYRRAWDPLEPEEGDALGWNLLRISAQDASEDPVGRNVWLNNVEELVIEVATNIGGQSILRNRRR